MCVPVGKLSEHIVVIQTLSVAGSSIRQNLLTYSSSGVAPTSQGPTQ